MKISNLIILFLAVALTQSCTGAKGGSADSASDTQIYWVSGTKAECDAGAGKMQCLQVHKGADLENADWEYFYTGIEGFNFEEGYLKKIEVKEEKIDPAQMPADASSVKYTMVKELEKKQDYRSLIGGDWILQRLNDKPVAGAPTVPTLQIDLKGKRVSGNNGCNNYSSGIEKLTPNSIELGVVAATKKACKGDNLEARYSKAFNNIDTYQIKGENLIFYGNGGNKLLSFRKEKEGMTANQRLHDIWVVTAIDGKNFDRSQPAARVEINLTEMRVMGNDGCNEYQGKIEKATENALVFGNLAGTKKMCPSMEMSQRFNEAMKKVAGYRVNGLKLMLLNAVGEEVLALRKVD